MSDALSLLRNSIKNKRDFHEEDDKIIFGDFFYPKNVKTTYLIYGTGKDGKPKDYYTLECLAFLIKNRDLQHPMYVKNAGTRNISVVSRPDRRDLLSYLDGEVETTSSIDKNAPLEIAMQRPTPYIKSSSSALAASSSSSTTSSTTAQSQIQQQQQQQQQQQSNSLKRPGQFLNNDDLSIVGGSSVSMDHHMSFEPKIPKISASQTSLEDSKMMDSTTSSLNSNEQFIERLTKKFDGTASRPITENIISLSEELTKEKIASIKAKKKAQQRKQVSSGVDMIDDDMMNVAASSSTAILSSSNLNALNSSQQQLNETGQSYGIESGNRLSQTTSNNKLGFESSYLSNSLIGGSGGLMSSDENDAIMKEIKQRESICRTRFSVLQSSGKQFEKDINAFLQLIKAKEDGVGGNGINMGDASSLNAIQSSNTSSQQSLINQLQILTQQQQQQLITQQQQKSTLASRSLGYNRFDQERYGGGKDETGGFSIDTKGTYQPNGGTLSLTPNPNSATPSQNPNDKQNSNFYNKQPTSSTTTSNNTQLTQKSNASVNNRHNIPPSIPISGVGSSIGGSGKKMSTRPIIIIPATSTSLITMYNALDVLQDLKYVSSEDKRKALQMQNQNAAPKDTEIVMHRREDGQIIQFKVIDNVNKLLPQDWDRVVAVFAQGKQWQFKEWPFGYGNPVDIFNKVKGFHLKMSGIPIDPNIAKWSVTVIELDPHKRHLDRARLLAFWDELYRFVLKSKPYLNV